MAVVTGVVITDDMGTDARTFSFQANEPLRPWTLASDAILLPA